MNVRWTFRSADDRAASCGENQIPPQEIRFPLLERTIMDFLVDAIKDTLIAAPILFLAYFAMEKLERSETLNEEILKNKSKKLGPLLGGLIGIIPQCGIAGAAATMFATGSITVGTMIAVFFATSDEMLPIMLSSNDISISQVGQIVAVKAFIGIILGYLVDFTFGHFFSKKNISDFCIDEKCSCDEEEGTALHSAVTHTLKIVALLFFVNLGLSLLLENIDTTGIFIDNPFLISIFGLIPNCSVSVIITEGYLSKLLSLRCLFAGLLANSGIGILVLFRTNKNIKENLLILAFLYILSSVIGLIFF